MDKVALITGSNKGIGFEIARQLASKGFLVFISGRSESRIQAAAKSLEEQGERVETLYMDVSDISSIRQAAREFGAKKLSLDVLINNAAILGHDDFDILKNEYGTLERVIDTNCFGALNVTKAFSTYFNYPARVINISSGGGSMTDPVGGWAPAYCVSKTMLNGITRHLAHSLEPKGVSVNSVCPGWVRTDMGGSGAPRDVKKGAETPVWLATEAPQEVTGKFLRDKKVIPW